MGEPQEIVAGRMGDGETGEEILPSGVSLGDGRQVCYEIGVLQYRKTLAQGVVYS